MNNRARHVQYRKSAYRKKRMKAIFIICAVALVLLFILFIIIGNALHEKTTDPVGEPSGSASGSDAAPSLKPARSINGYALKLLEDGSNFSDRLASIPEGASALSLPLNATDGTLYFRSTLTDELPFLSCHEDASALSAAISRTDSYDMYVSALLYVPSFAEENDLLRDVYLSAWCSVAVEAIRAGVGDCLIIPRGAGVDELDRICELALLIRAIEPDAVIGCSVPEDIISATANEAMIAKLAASFNYLALDTTNYKEDEDVISYVESRISQFQMQLIYRKMRVLLPYFESSEDMQRCIDTVKKYNISSWQVKPLD